MIKAVIFDMDGTLIDTEKYYRIFWPKALAEFGYKMTDEQALSMRSLGKPFAEKHLREMMLDPNLDYEAVRARRKNMMEACLKEKGIELKAGVFEILEYLKEKKIVRAIATANDKERAERYLKKIGIYEYFDKIICATMVAHGKPEPDVYQYACSQIGFPPSECMAVEDSPNGVKSAFLAGCKVVMIPDLTEPDEELKQMLYACTDHLEKIKDLLEE